MKRLTYDWLPDRHIGVAASLSHVDEIIGQISNILFQYQTHPDGIIRLNETVDGPTSQTRVVAISPLPRKIPLLVTDALSTLRNTLEHTLFTEVKHLDCSLTEKAARVVELPAAVTYADFRRWTKSRERNGPASLQPGSQLIQRIESLQPFQRIQDPHNHPLAVLVSHTNHAKHRMPAITAVRLAAMYRDDERPTSIDELARRPEGPLRVGEVIAETQMGTRLILNLFPSVGINRPGTSRWPILMTELDELTDWIRTQALPLLITGTSKHSVLLPAQYDISSGHTNDRVAIAKGTTVPATARHAQRLTAATARIDLSELVFMLEGAPKLATIKAWMATLTDEEVLTWSSELRAGGLEGVTTARTNLNTLRRMYDKALQFDRTVNQGHS